MAKGCAGRRFFQRFLRFRRRRPSLSPTPCRHPTKEKPPLATMQKAERTENMTNRSERPKKGQQTLIAPIFYRERPFHGKTHSTNHTLPLIFSHAAGVVNICSRLFRRSPTPLFAPFRPRLSTSIHKKLVFRPSSRVSSPYPFIIAGLKRKLQALVSQKQGLLWRKQALPARNQGLHAPRQACNACTAGCPRPGTAMHTQKPLTANRKIQKTAKQNNRNQGTGNTLRAPPPRSRTLRQAPRKTKPKENYKFFNESLATIQYLITFAATNANITRLLLKNTTRTPVKKALILQEP